MFQTLWKLAYDILNLNNIKEWRRNLIVSHYLYDEADPISIENYGKRMIGKTMRQIYEERVDDEIVGEEKSAYVARHENKKYKGGIGNLIEECWFGYRANSDAEADFSKAGVELKVTPYLKNKRGFRAKERLVLTMINYMEVVKEKDFKHSHLWDKAQLMLLVWYLHISGQSDMDSTVDYVQLFTPPEEDLRIIQNDYDKIIGKIRAGKAHELSEGDTLYLGACTKSASSRNRRQQPYSEIPAKPRAFSFKNSYMTYVLLHYIMPGRKTYEPIVKSGVGVSDFEQYVMNQIAMGRGKSIEELAGQFGIQTKSKNIGAVLAYRLLGVKSNQCEEFEKAGIAVKTIRIMKNGKIKENMSFPPIRYTELAKETWEDSFFGNYLADTRFLFVVYREDEEGNFRLQGAQFWNIPTEDLEGDVRSVWQETHDIISQGRLTINKDGRGRYVNNLPKKVNHSVSHVRPHGRDRNDVASLPEGTHIKLGPGVTWDDDMAYTKQCFWLNNDYILNQLKPELKE